MRRLAVLVALVALTVPVPTAAAPDPLTCEGYPQPRIFIETQDWWTPIHGLPESTTGHVHLGMCWPTVTVSGDLQIDVRVVFHDNLGEWTRLKGQDDDSDNFYLEKPNLQLPAGDLTAWRSVVIDTTQLKDGVRQMRWYADVEHANGNTQTARSAWPLDVENGKADDNAGKLTQEKYLNWYRVDGGTDYGYTGPTITRTGTRTFSVKCTTNGGPAIDRTIIHVDPNFHAGDEGTVIKDVAGAFKGTVTTPTGSERLVVRCRQEQGDETHEGVGLRPAT